MNITMITCLTKEGSKTLTTCISFHYFVSIHTVYPGYSDHLGNVIMAHYVKVWANRTNMMNKGALLPRS